MAFAANAVGYPVDSCAPTPSTTDDFTMTETIGHD